MKRDIFHNIWSFFFWFGFVIMLLYYSNDGMAEIGLHKKTPMWPGRIFLVPLCVLKSRFMYKTSLFVKALL